MLFPLSNSYFAVRFLVAASVAGSLGCWSRPAPRSQLSDAQTNQALASVKELRPRCYDPSALARAGTKIVLDFRLEVELSGSVRAVPVFAEPDDPDVIECVRRELNQIRFPAHGRDRFDLHFEMGH
jgi:hypothetical protein